MPVSMNGGVMKCGEVLGVYCPELWKAAQDQGFDPVGVQHTSKSNQPVLPGAG